MDIPVDRKELLEKLRNNASSLDRFGTSNFQSDLRNFRPAIEEAWTIQEQLSHILDSEMSLFLRMRQAIASPGSEARPGVPLDSWQELFDHPEQSAEDTVEAFKKIHAIAYKLLKGFENQDWSNFFVNHTTNGKQTLDDLLRIIAGHVEFHLELIERNEKLWGETNS